MHHIRLLRPITIRPAPHRKGLFNIKVLLTITTDLGEFPYAPSEPLAISFAVGQFKDRVLVCEHERGPIYWKAGMHVLEDMLEIQAPDLLEGLVTLSIFATTQPMHPYRHFRASQADCAPPYWRHGLKDPPFELIVPCHIDFENNFCERLSYRILPKSFSSCLIFEEDLGQSIARHIWDAGLITASFISDRSSDNEAISSVLPIESKKDVINVLELGSGIGVLGITLASVLGDIANTQGCGDPAVNVLLTDVAEAKERADSNIARAYQNGVREQSDRVTLEYENLDWDDGRHGKFGPLVAARYWDYIVLSDCTYNPDSFPALVETLSAVHRQNCTMAGSEVETRALLAAKPRHSAEESLFGILEKSDWRHRITKSIPIFRRNEESEAIHIYMLEKGNISAATSASTSSSEKKRKASNEATEGSASRKELDTKTLPTKKTRS